MPTLALIRHGQSQWNLENRFTGWWDADLTEKGEAEARHAGELLREAGFAPRQAFSSVQTRAIRTLWLALTEMGLVWLPVEKNWRLNERHYGGLTGLDKKRPPRSMAMNRSISGAAPMTPRRRRWRRARSMICPVTRVMTGSMCRTLKALSSPSSASCHSGTNRSHPSLNRAPIR